jgi:hypothetical protein
LNARLDRLRSHCRLWTEGHFRTGGCQIDLFEILARARKLLLARGRVIVDSLNVSQFLAAYNASLANVRECKASTITGILRPKSDQIYRGGLYSVLMDGGGRLALRMPECYRHLSGRRVEVIGQPNRQTRKITGKLRSSCAVRASRRLTPLRKIGSDIYGPSERGADLLGQRSRVPSRAESSQETSRAC